MMEIAIKKDWWELNFKNLNYLIFILFVGLIIFRHPDFFIEPRFWAEEGSIYFTDAYHNKINALFHPHLGYFSIVPNIATYIATLAPLKQAPLITTFIAFFIQIIPFFIVLISNSEITNSSLKKLIVSLIILFVTDTGEVWLNTITSQFHFVIIAFLILLDLQNDINKIKLYFYTFLILISGLSGIPANVLAPVFLYTYFITQKRIILYFFGILVFTLSIQVLSLIISLPEVHNRFHLNSFLDVIKVVYRITIGTFQYPFFQTMKPIVGTLFVLPLFYIIYKSIKEDKYSCIFFCTSVFLTLVFVLTSLNMWGGPRYYYAPNVILVLGLFYLLIKNNTPKYLKNLSAIYIAISIIVGIYKFPIKDGTYDSKNWVKWKEQIEKIENYEEKEVKIYPQWKGTNWIIRLRETK